MPRFDVTIVGELNLDVILYGLPSAMTVERELIASDLQVTLGSSSAIFAHNLALLGARVGFITKTGGDAFGPIALEYLQRAGVDLSRASQSSTSKTGLTVLLHHGTTRHILTYPGTMATLTIADVDMTYLAESRHVHVASFFLQTGLQADLPQMSHALRSKGLTVSLDTNDDPEDRWDGTLQSMLKNVDIVMPNEHEARRMARTEDVSEAMHRLAKIVPVVVVKCGSDGALVQRGDQRWQVAAPRVTPVDTIGAGDSFNAGFLAAFLDGKPLPACADAGNVAAALSTLRGGGVDAFQDATLRQTFLKQWHTTSPSTESDAR